MRRFLPLLKMMMLAVLLWTGNVAHAEELECSAPAAVDVNHAEQNQQDESPSDPGKAAQHQHTGCHGHHVANPSTGLAEPTNLAGAQLKFGRVTPSGAGASPDSALRPPIA